MTKAAQAQVNWDSQKKSWQVRIQVGEEVIKRPAKVAANAADETLRALAVTVAQDEGYAVEASQVTIVR
jgi:hypothetical protein